MTDECWTLDGHVLTYCVEVEILSFVERVTGNGDAMVVERENLDEWGAFEYD